MTREPDADRMANDKIVAPKLEVEILSKPSKDLAAKILAEVNFENRFIGYKMRERSGTIRVTSYSFEEIVHLLNDRMPQISLEVLGKWLREVMGDEELADKIAAIREKGESDLERILLARNLAETRLRQCKAIEE